MATLKIETYPASILRKMSNGVAQVGDKESMLLQDMTRTMYLSHGIGLAAPQIGLNVRVAVVDIGNGVIKMINPRIVKRSGMDVMEEGCLSVPGASVNVRRAKKIVVKYIDKSGDETTLEAEGLLARAIQHEIDHLNGRLIIDYMNPIKRFFLKPKLR